MTYAIAVMTSMHCGVAIICWRQIWPLVYATFDKCESAKAAMHKGAAVKCVARDEVRK